MSVSGYQILRVLSAGHFPGYCTQGTLRLKTPIGTAKVFFGRRSDAGRTHARLVREPAAHQPYSTSLLAVHLHALAPPYLPSDRSLALAPVSSTTARSGGNAYSLDQQTGTIP
jgi:hypothetical protein